MKTIQEFASVLFEIEVNAHIAHLQTTSFAQHLALDELYKAMPGLRDQFLENYQGQNKIITGYKPIIIKEGIDMVKYLTERRSDIFEFRSTISEGYLQQDIDDILSLLSSVIYKLKNLK